MAEVLQRVFQEKNFPCRRDWLLFCLEYDLRICDGCRRRAARRPGGIQGHRPWHCEECASSVHVDLWESIRSGRDAGTTCGLCEAQVSIRDCWISEDCQRLYCKKHLQPLQPRDRFRLTARYLRQGGAPATVDREDLLERVHAIREHVRESACDRCPFNGRGIYHHGDLVEVERGEGKCDCAPDTLNCAGLPS